MGLDLRPVDDSVIDRVRLLYETAFPREERIPLADLRRMAEGPDCDFLWLDADGEFAGMVYLVSSDTLVFLLYLAIAQGRRNEGLGSDAVWLVKMRAGGRRVFLNAEPADSDAPNIGQRLRRMSFYDRNGFSPQGDHTTPDGMRYTRLSWGGPVTDEEAEELYRTRMPRPSGDQ